MKVSLAVIGLVVMGLAGRVEAVVVYSGIQDLTIGHESNEEHEFSFPGVEQSFPVFDEREGIIIRGGASVYSIVRDPGSSSMVRNFEFGELIDSQLDWKAPVTSNILVAYWDGAENRGNFYDRTESYVAVRTELETSEYFGWLRVSHSAEKELFTVHDWAWNTTAGEPILAGQIPEPATYAKLFGIGVLVFVVWRRVFRGRKDGIR